MPLFLRHRDTDSEERMDDPGCDRGELFNTYRQFSVINALISRWKGLYNDRIRPACREEGRTYTLLDIGFGGGDIPLKLHRWAQQDGIVLDITAIETDERACSFVGGLDTPARVRFRHISSTDLLKEGNRYDFVISNHLLHHLGDAQLKQMLDEARKLSYRKVLFNDIERSDTGYLLFNLLARPLFRSSFITADGLTSIKRSYTAAELQSSVPESWQVERLFPFRLLLTYSHHE